jgi:hypothetical protein
VRSYGFFAGSPQLTALWRGSQAHQYARKIMTNDDSVSSSFRLGSVHISTNGVGKDMWVCVNAEDCDPVKAFFPQQFSNALPLSPIP